MSQKKTEIEIKAAAITQPKDSDDIMPSEDYVSHEVSVLLPESMKKPQRHPAVQSATILIVALGELSQREGRSYTANA